MPIISIKQPIDSFSLFIYLIHHSFLVSTKFSDTTRIMITLLGSFMIVSTVLYSTSAQYFTPTPEGVTVLKSKFQENVTVSYKEICLLFSFHRVYA
jgi:hypothetical protein